MGGYLGEVTREGRRKERVTCFNLPTLDGMWAVDFTRESPRI